MSDLVGRTLGQYRIVGQLGKGGMATVYRAFQPSLERYVAIKVLMPYFAHEEGFGQRFVREAKAIARLDHPHILPIYDYGQEGDVHYIVMKCVDAGTLKDLEAGEPLPLDLGVTIVSQIAGALDHAHERGVIHRDVKPANVLLDQGGWVFLTDFGLARMVEGSQQLTLSGVGVGTPAYMSPEQCQGRSVDRRADIYSLGIVLYEMLTGCVPYEAETPLAVVLKHITEPLPMPRKINPALSETVELVILKALAKEPGDRYQSAGEMATALCNAAECVEVAPLTDSPSAESAAAGVTSLAAEREIAVPIPADAKAHPPVPETTGTSVTEEPVSKGSRTASSEDGVALGTIFRAKPVPLGRRLPWWAYVAAAAAVLSLLVAGAWLGLREWPRGTDRAVVPALLGRETLTPSLAVPAAEAATATPEAVESTLPLASPGDRLRVAISVRPGMPVEAGVQRLAQFLAARTGTKVDAIAIDGPQELLGLLRGNDADVVLLGMPEYLWLRDDEGIPLAPALYAEPIFAGVVVIRADGDVRTADHLRGRPIAVSSWDAPATLLGRAALMDQGLDVERESEVRYVAPGDTPEVTDRALALLSDRDVAAVILSNLALQRIEQRAPTLADRLRILVESPPTSVGVVAVHPDMPAEQISALRAAFLELDPEFLRTEMPFGRLVAVDEPLADHMADALHKLDISAWQWVEGIPRESQVSQDQPVRPLVSSDMRVALLPAAGSSVEGNRFVTSIFGGLQRASQDFGLELDVRETSEDEQPGDGTLDLIGKGYNVIVVVSWRDADMLWGIAREHPEVRFVYFGGHEYPEPLPNLLGLAYRMDQAGFLAGALAGSVTESGRVAVIGGIPLPSVEQLVSGFDRGARQACPECEVIVHFTDTFSDLSRGEEFGRQVVEEGADVVFNAAGASGSAALRSAAEQGAWVIGVDWDEYATTFRGGQVPHVERLLGSVVIRAEDQAYETIERLVRGDFESGNLVLGVAQGGIEFLPSPQSAYPRWPELEQSMQELTERVRNGEIKP